MPKFKSKQKNNNNNIKKSFSEIKKKLEWLDPFHYVDLFAMPVVKKYTDSQFVEGVVNLFFAGMFATMVYFGLSLLFGSSTPLVIVYSESMEPAFFRGDIMGLTGANVDSSSIQEIVLNRKISGVPVSEYTMPNYDGVNLKSIIFENGEEIFLGGGSKGDVIVYTSYPQNIPIIHRTIIKINAEDGTFFLTKGDNQKTNPTYDQDCGKILLNNPEKSCITFFAVKPEEIQGKAFFRIPMVGCLKLWLVDDLLSIMTTGKLPPNFNGFC